VGAWSGPPSAALTLPRLPFGALGLGPSGPKRGPFSALFGPFLGGFGLFSGRFLAGPGALVCLFGLRPKTAQKGPQKAPFFGWFWPFLGLRAFLWAPGPRSRAGPGRSGPCFGPFFGPFSALFRPLLGSFPGPASPGPEPFDWRAWGSRAPPAASALGPPKEGVFWGLFRVFLGSFLACFWPLFWALRAQKSGLAAGRVSPFSAPSGPKGPMGPQIWPLFPRKSGRLFAGLQGGGLAGFSPPRPFGPKRCFRALWGAPIGPLGVVLAAFPVFGPFSALFGPFWAFWPARPLRGRKPAYQPIWPPAPAGSGPSGP